MNLLFKLQKEKNGVGKRRSRVALFAASLNFVQYEVVCTALRRPLQVFLVYPPKHMNDSELSTVHCRQRLCGNFVHEEHAKSSVPPSLPLGVTGLIDHVNLYAEVEWYVRTLLVSLHTTLRLTSVVCHFMRTCEKRTS